MAAKGAWALPLLAVAVVVAPGSVRLALAVRALNTVVWTMALVGPAAQAGLRMAPTAEMVVTGATTTSVRAAAVVVVRVPWAVWVFSMIFHRP
ncbi:hypothetical protein ACJRW5_22285 [Pseudomonas sp. SH1-B]